MAGDGKLLVKESTQRSSIVEKSLLMDEDLVLKEELLVSRSTW